MTRSPCLALRRALLAATVSASAALRRALFAARFSVRLGRSVCLSAGPVAHSLQPRQCPSGLLHRSAQDVSGTASWHHARHGASGASASELNSEWPFGREAPHATASASPARARRISLPGRAAHGAATREKPGCLKREVSPEKERPQAEERLFCFGVGDPRIRRASIQELSVDGPAWLRTQLDTWEKSKLAAPDWRWRWRRHRRGQRLRPRRSRVRSGGHSTV